MSREETVDYYISAHAYIFSSIQPVRAIENNTGLYQVVKDAMKRRCG
jgi:hypothetical protein